MAIVSGGKSSGRSGRSKGTSSSKQKGGKASKSKYEPIKPGKTSPGTMHIEAPKAVKSPNDHSSNQGHSFGYFRLGIEKR